MQRTYNNNSTNPLGLLLVVIGGLFLLGGVIGFTAFVIGKVILPAALLIVGAIFLQKQIQQYQATKRLEFPWPVFLILIGASGLLKLIGLHLGLFSWPVWLILVGLWMVINRR